MMQVSREGLRRDRHRPLALAQRILQRTRLVADDDARLRRREDEQQQEQQTG
jgi:hypothetical protein